MKMKLSSLSRIAVAAMGALAFLSVDASAQGTGNFENATGGAVYQVGTNGGVIRLRCTDSKIVASGGNTIGTDDIHAVPGIVEFGRTGAGQNVQALHYTNLLMSGGTKSIPDGVYVSGNGYASPLGGAPLYASMSTGNGYFVASGTGARNYAGTFNYTGANAQNIFAEGDASGSDNKYNTLYLDGAAGKTIQFALGADAGRVIVKDNVILNGSTPLNVYDDLSINTTGTTASTFSGPIVVGDATTTEQIQFKTGGAAATFSGLTFIVKPLSEFAVGGTGDVTIAGADTVIGGNTSAASGRIAVLDGSSGDLIVTGSLTLVDGTGTADGHIYLGTGGTTMQITGNLYNNVACAERSNVIFSDASTVIYNNPATQVVMGTLATNDYANLTIAGAGDKTADCDIYMRNDLAMGGTANLFLTPNNATPGYTLYRNVTAAGVNPAVSYAVTNNTQHIQGNMKLIGTIKTGVDYVMNNAHTKVRFGAAPSTEFGFRVIPGVALADLHRVASDIDANIELPRMVRVMWTGGTPLVTALEVGYTDADLAAAPTTLSRENKIKFFEAYDITKAKSKINGQTGTLYDRDVAANWVRQNYGGTGVSLVAATTSGNPNNDIAADADIVLGAGAIQTIANGRWSDPATWDEGVMPAADDDAIVRHAVWTGNDAGQFGGNAYGSPERDFNTGAAGASARNVTIMLADGTFTNPALVIDGADTDYANNYKFGITGNLTNENTNIMAAGVDGDAAGTPATSMQGLWVRPVNTATQNVLSVGGIINRGGVMNKGIIEICNQ